MMIPPRILFGISREGFFIGQGAKINNGGTPYVAVLVCYLLTIIFILYNTFEQIFAVAAVMLTVVTAMSFASLLMLRKTHPELNRPYKAWGYPYMTIIALIVTVILFVGFAISDTRSFIIIAIIAAASYPGYKIVLRANKVAVAN